MPIGVPLGGRCIERHRPEVVAPGERFVLVDSAERLGGGESGQAALASRNPGVQDHSVVEAGDIPRDEHGIDAGPHPVVVVRRPPATLGRKGEVAPQKTEQLHVGNQADSEADGVGGDHFVRSGNRLAVFVDLNQYDGLDLVRTADGFLDGVGRVELHTRAPQPGLEGLVAAHGGGDVHDGGHLDTSVPGHPGGGEAQVAGAQDHHAPRGQRPVPTHQRVRAVGAHDARHPRPGKGHRQVTGAGGHDEPVVLDHPRPLVVGQPELRAVEDPAGFGVAKGAPDTRAKLNLDASVLGFRQRVVGRGHPVQHHVPGGERVDDPFAEEVRDVQPHHGSADWVLVDEHDPHAGSGRLDGGGRARHPRPDDHQRYRFHLKSLPSIRGAVLGQMCLDDSGFRVTRAYAPFRGDETRSGSAPLRALVYSAPNPQQVPMTWTPISTQAAASSVNSAAVSSLARLLSCQVSR